VRTAGVLGSLLLLGWASQHDRLAVAGLVCLLRVLGVRDLQHVLPITLAYYFLAEPFQGFAVSQPPSIGRLLESRYGVDLLGSASVKYLGLICRLALGYGAYRLLSGLEPQRRLLCLHLLLLATMLVCGNLLHAGPALAALSMSCLLAFSTYFFYLCYLALDCRGLSPGQFVTLYVAPFWETSTVPRPVLDLRPERDKQQALDQRCVRVAVGSAGLIIIGGLAHAALFGKTFHGHTLPWSFAPLPDLEATGLNATLFGLYPRWQIWVSIFWSSLHRITNYFCLFVLIECCFLALGYDVPRRFTLPLRASSFAGFYNGLMPYYILLINRLYFYPLYSWLRKHAWDRYRAYDAALCFAIVFGGLMTHIVRDVHLVALVGVGEYLARYVVYGSPYFLLIFLSIRFVKLPQRWPAWVKFPLLLAVYSVVFLSRMDGLFLTWEERARFCQALFWGPQ
jgi:hypothetical protein